MHFKSSCLWGVLLLGLLIIQTRAIQPDYADEGGDALLSSSSDNESTDDVYNPALMQQDIELDEHRKEMAEEQESAATEAPAIMTTMTTHLENKQDKMKNNISKEYENASEEVEEESMESAKEERKSRTASLDSANEALDQSAEATLVTTMIPEYIRKGKSNTVNSLGTHSSEGSPLLAMDHKVSNVAEKESTHNDMNLPIPMKFYQPFSQEEEEDEEDDVSMEHNSAEDYNTMENKLSSDTPSPQFLDMPLEQQQLPKEQRAQQFQDPQPQQVPAQSRIDVLEDNGEPEVHLHAKSTASPAIVPSTGALPFAPYHPPSTPAPAMVYDPFRLDLQSRSAALPTGFSLYGNKEQALPETIWSPAMPRPASTTDRPATTIIASSTTSSPGLLSTEAPATTSTTSTPITTTIMSYITTTAATAEGGSLGGAGGKQGKQINISTRRKLLPHEQLRNYIEDAYIRMPLAVIVDPSSGESLEKTKALWNDALRTNINIKIVLVALNASGAPAAYNFNNTRQFLAGLNSFKEHSGGDPFIGIVHASELVPYDSAVFICTAMVPPHTELVQDAAITLLKKRIRLYLVWFGERSLTENETQDAVGGILGEVAIRSGGEILHIVGSDNSQELEGTTLTIVADAFRGNQEIDIPVDTTLSSLHVKIDAPMRTAVLETPNGDINLRKLVKFKSRVFPLGPDDKRLDAFVPLTKLRKATVFKLKMVPENEDQEYGVFVRADRKSDLFLDDIIKHLDTLFMGSLSHYPTRLRNNYLHRVTGPITARIMHTHDNLRFPESEEQQQPKSNRTKAEPKNEVETFSDTEIRQNPTDVELTKAKNDAPKALAGVTNSARNVNILQRGLTKIEMGVNSQVLVAPGMMATLNFEVTNTRTEPIMHNIQVVDERRYLLRLVPRSLLLQPGEMATVVVTLAVPNGTPQGTIDHITFTCHGGGTASLSLNLKVISSADAQDTTPPTINWTWGNRCEYVPADSAQCGERFWSMDINAQDWDTGIMRLQTTPATGLMYRNSYTVGTAEPLKATYIATCCEPKVAIMAFDVAGNQRSYNIDVRDIYLTDAAIAAIVLGAILLILLVALIIAAIVRCCRNRKVVLDLPTYRSHSTRSME